MTWRCSCPDCVRLLAKIVPPGPDRRTYVDMPPPTGPLPPRLEAWFQAVLIRPSARYQRRAPPFAPLPAGGDWWFMPAGLAAALEGSR